MEIFQNFAAHLNRLDFSNLQAKICDKMCSIISYDGELIYHRLQQQSEFMLSHSHLFIFLISYLDILSHNNLYVL